MPAVINLSIHRNRVNDKPATLDGVEVGEALRRLEAAGADVVGLNCARGPATMLPLFENLEKGSIKVRLSLTYRRLVGHESFCFSTSYFKSHFMNY